MPIEAKAVESFNLEEVYGEEFKVPSITRVTENYRIKNLNLFFDWKDSNNLKKIDIKTYCNNFDREHGDDLNGQVIYDPKTNLITEISLNFLKTQSSRVYLEDNYFSSSEYGSYKSENITNLSAAILYQEFLARYLSYASDSRYDYPYIFYLNANMARHYGSADLHIPEDVYEKLSHPATNNYYQEHAFPLIASHICGQFSTRFRYLEFDEEGFLQSVNIDSDACSYDLSEFIGRKSYSPHNVDNKYQAATHHGIVAEFINDLIERKEDQED